MLKNGVKKSNLLSTFYFKIIYWGLWIVFLKRPGENILYSSKICPWSQDSRLGLVILVGRENGQ